MLRRPFAHRRPASGSALHFLPVHTSRRPAGPRLRGRRLPAGCLAVVPGCGGAAHPVARRGRVAAWTAGTPARPSAALPPALPRPVHHSQHPAACHSPEPVGPRPGPARPVRHHDCHPHPTPGSPSSRRASSCLSSWAPVRPEIITGSVRREQPRCLRGFAQGSRVWLPPRGPLGAASSGQGQLLVAIG